VAPRSPGRLRHRPFALYQPFPHERLQDDERGPLIGARLGGDVRRCRRFAGRQGIDDPGAHGPGYQKEPFNRSPVYERFPHARSNSSPAATHSFRPPAKSHTLVKPNCRSLSAAMPLASQVNPLQ
jgi:hypothetical protein